jgi:outer membrane protein TolC
MIYVRSALVASMAALLAAAEVAPAPKPPVAPQPPVAAPNQALGPNAAAAAAAVPPAPVQPAGARLLDNAAAEQLARSVAPTIMAARMEQMAATSEVRAANAARYPTLTGGLSAQYSREFDPVAVPVVPSAVAGGQSVWMPGRGGELYGAGVRAEQLVYSFERVESQVRSARETEEAARQGALGTERDAVFSVLVAMEAVRFARAARVVAAEQLRQRDEEKRDAEALQAAGQATQLDVRQAEISRVGALDQLLQADEQIRQSLLELERLVNQPKGSLDVAGDLRRPADLPQALTAAEQALAGGADLAALDAQRRALLAGSEALRRSYLPTVSVFGQAGTNGPDVDDQTGDYAVGAALNWRFYDGGDSWARREASERRAQALGFKAMELLRARSRELDGIRGDLSTIDQRIRLLAGNIKLASDNYEDGRKVYRAGQTTLTRLGELSLALIQARFRLVSAAYDEAILAHQLTRLSR